MKTVRNLVLAAAALIPLLAASPASAEFLLEKYFAGRTVAEGSFSAITGAKRDFDVVLTGRWNGRTLTLVEDFVFDDGKRDRKTWRFTKTGENTYRGTREDVVGETLVTVTGDTARFTYLVYLDPEKRRNLVRFHDKMTLKKDGTVENRALVTKFGLPVGTTRVDFRRP